MSRHHVAGGRDVRPGQLAPFVVDGRRIVVANVDGVFTIVDELCPHLSIPLSQGRLDGACLTCVGHGSVFELPDGTVKRWMGRRPGLVSQLLSGKPTPLRPLRLSLDDGELYLEA